MGLAGGEDRRGGSLFSRLFPTDPTERLQPLPWFVNGDTLRHKIHLGSAVALFLCFTIFSLFLFTKSKKPKAFREHLRTGRDKVYVLCGVMMLGFLVWAIVNNFTGRPIFWQEALALEFFGISWLTKARADEMGKRLWKRCFPRK